MKAVLIWDLDGTLLDSYHVIVSALVQTAERCGVTEDPDEVLEIAKRTSVGRYEKLLAEKTGADLDELRACYRELTVQMEDGIVLMPDAAEVLKALAEAGCEHFVYTHKGNRAFNILERLGVKQYFREIVTAENGFRYKPDPEAVNYLLEKYGISKEDAYYVGDRDLDVQCAENAGIHSILLTSEYCQCRAEHEVTCLKEICKIFRAEL